MYGDMMMVIYSMVPLSCVVYVYSHDLLIAYYAGSMYALRVLELYIKVHLVVPGSLSSRKTT